MEALTLTVRAISDPFGKALSKNISKKELDPIVVGDDTDAWAVVHRAIEDFAQELAHVTRRFLKTRAWEKTERIVIGGGFRDGRLGELAIARAEIILKAENFNDPPSRGRRRPYRRAPSRSFLDLRSA